MNEDQGDLFAEVDAQLMAQALTYELGGPGQARITDPDTSQEAARLIRAKATTARVRLLEEFGRWDDLTDEEAASRAGLSMLSEYATRCSELDRAGMVQDTGRRRRGAAGAERMVRAITPLGRYVLTARAQRKGTV